MTDERGGERVVGRSNDRAAAENGHNFRSQDAANRGRSENVKFGKVRGDAGRGVVVLADTDPLATHTLCPSRRR